MLDDRDLEILIMGIKSLEDALLNEECGCVDLSECCSVLVKLRRMQRKRDSRERRLSENYKELYAKGLLQERVTRRV